MFGFFKSKTSIELLGLEDGLARFRANKKLQPGTNVEAEALLPHKHRYAVRLRVLEALPGSLYQGRLGPPDVAEIVAEDYARATHQLHYKGTDEPTHHIRRYPVRGRELPNFKGVTTDLSMAKARLELDAPLPLGKTLDLTLELDDHRLPQVGVRCEVISCGPLPLGKTEVGVRWILLDPRHEPMLEAYLKRLKRGIGE